MNNNWLAVPLAIDFRIFKFNSTTFDHCINNRYDLKYPPVIFNKYIIYIYLIFINHIYIYKFNKLASK